MSYSYIGLCICVFHCDIERPDPSPPSMHLAHFGISYSDQPHASCFDVLIHHKVKMTELIIYGIKPLKPSAKTDLPLKFFLRSFLHSGRKRLTPCPEYGCLSDFLIWDVSFPFERNCENEYLPCVNKLKYQRNRLHGLFFIILCRQTYNTFAFWVSKIKCKIKCIPLIINTL